MKTTRLLTPATLHKQKPWNSLLRSPGKDLVQFAFLIAVGAWLISLSTARLGYYWQWYRLPRYVFRVEAGRLVAGELIEGLLFTFRISGVSLALALALGLATALLRLSDSFMGRLLTRVYLEVIRNTPLLVQIYLLYFVIGPILGLGRFASAVLALSLFEGAYMSEILRAGIVSLHKGQWEAAYSLGLSRLDTYRDIILPQAIRRILPPLTGEVISLIKNTSLVGLVSLSDLALQARVIAADTFLTFEVWFVTALIYLAVTVPLSLAVYAMEKRFRVLT
jgi:polar amino acid transport system permease protein